MIALSPWDALGWLLFFCVAALVLLIVLLLINVAVVDNKRTAKRKPDQDGGPTCS